MVNVACKEAEGVGLADIMLAASPILCSIKHFNGVCIEWE